MKDELFKKVYIKTEDDLPKEEHYYFVQYKNITGERGNEKFVGNKEYWLRFIDWYLQPNKISNNIKNQLIEKLKEVIKIFEDWLERDLVIKDSIVYFDDRGGNQEISRLKSEIITLEKQIEEQKSKTDDQELFNKIEQAVSDYLKTVDIVNRKDCIENDFRHGISLGLSLRNQFKTKNR